MAYDPALLEPLGWATSDRVPGAARALGLDLDQRLAYYVDTNARLVGIDLEVGVARPYAEHVRLATVGPDGSAFAVDSGGRVLRVARRTPTRLPADLQDAPRALFGTLNGQVVTVTADSQAELSLRLVSVEQAGEAIGIGGARVTATYWGELVASAAEDRIEFRRPGDQDPIRRFRTASPVTDLGFSPSGHRLHVLTTANQIETWDRFTGQPVGTIDLPGAADAIRMSPTGRWLLVHPVDAEAVWVVDLPSGVLLSTIPTRWTPALPMVAGSSSLLAADGEDVVGYDLTDTTAAAYARVIGAAEDRWLPMPWVPRQRARETVAAAESALVAQDSLILAVLPPRARGPALYLQVSSSQNPDWAEDLATRLSDEGFPASVWIPTGLEEGYRVVVGPYPTREEADEAGRRLDRPYFVVLREPGQR